MAVAALRADLHERVRRGTAGIEIEMSVDLDRAAAVGVYRGPCERGLAGCRLQLDIAVDMDVADRSAAVGRGIDQRVGMRIAPGRGERHFAADVGVRRAAIRALGEDAAVVDVDVVAVP